MYFLLQITFINQMFINIEEEKTPFLVVYKFIKFKKNCIVDFCMKIDLNNLPKCYFTKVIHDLIF